MASVEQDHVAVAFVNASVRAEGTLHIPPGSRLSDFINKNRQFLPVNDVVYTDIASGKPVQKAAFALLNLENFHSIIPTKASAVKRKLKSRVTIGDIMSKNLITIGPHTTTQEAFRIMKDRGIHHLPVMEKNKLTGLCSMSDVRMYLLHQPTDPVRHFMKTKVYVVPSSEDFQDAIKKMVEYSVSCFPVVDDKELVGIVTERDLFKHISREWL